MTSARLRSLGWLLAGLASGCGGARGIPDPEVAVARYAEAVATGDAKALHAMLDPSSRRELSVGEVSRILGEQRAELAEHARAVSAPGRAIVAEARLRFEDGETAVLELSDGAFRVKAATALPGNARTPEQALGQLRAVLARRSYPGLLRVLTSRTRSAMESDLRSLVDGLVEPDALDVEVKGDTATAHVPGGHRVKLRREEGAWFVEDLD